MPVDSSFFAAVISAGAILTGFCGTFLAFRIQREASYHRQPVLSFEAGAAKDVFIGLTHFTHAFLLLILATSCALVFGFIVPLLALAKVGFATRGVGLVVGGLLAAVVFLAAYFLAELLHYRILSTRLMHDLAEQKSVRGVVFVAILLAIASFTLSWLAL